MKITINKYDFINAFESSDTYKNNFTYDALVELFDHFEAREDDSGDQIEFDVVAICRDYAQSTWQEIASEYDLELEHPKNDEDLNTYEEQVHEFLLERSPVVIELLCDGTFVYHSVFRH